MFKTIALGSGILAGLCVVGLPAWLLGLPGIENKYARGWKMGLAVLMLYPLAWFFDFVPFFFMRNRVAPATRDQWESISGGVGAVLVVALILGLAQSFRVMSSKD